MQRKKTLVFKYKQDILGTIFVVEGFLAENVQSLQFISIQWDALEIQNRIKIIA